MAVNPEACVPPPQSDVIQRLTYRKIMYAEYQVCHNWCLLTLALPLLMSMPIMYVVRPCVRTSTSDRQTACACHAHAQNLDTAYF